MDYLFYRLDPGELRRTELSLPDRYDYLLWKPSFASVVPAGISFMPFAVWWAMHQLRAFANDGYGLFIIYYQGTLVHRSGVYPRYFRFPFMGEDDLQIGDTWTNPEFRDEGLATFAVQKVVEQLRRPGRAFWYVVEAGNTPSVHVIEKAGFVRVGRGVKEPRCGLTILGSYAIRRSYLTTES